MPTPISNKGLVEKCKRFVLTDPTSGSIDELVKDALISAEREIRRVDSLSPLAWLKEDYNELFTRPYASITAITQATPGVFTAESSDSDISGHGFSEDDIAFISGVVDMDRLNNRIFRVKVIDADTFSLCQLHDKIVVNTSGYDEYGSGGTIYNCGLKLPATAIEPTASLEATASYRWSIGRILDVTFDLSPSKPITENEVGGNACWLNTSARPVRWRHQRYGYGSLASGLEHLLFFYPLAGVRHNIRISFEKDYPDMNVWDDATYPPHPPEVHDAIWHRALFNLSTNTQKQQRATEQMLDTSIEVLHSQVWGAKRREDEAKIIEFSRSLLGASQGVVEVRA